MLYATLDASNILVWELDFEVIWIHRTPKRTAIPLLKSFAILSSPSSSALLCSALLCFWSTLLFATSTHHLHHIQRAYYLATKMLTTYISRTPLISPLLFFCSSTFPHFCSRTDDIYNGPLRPCWLIKGGAPTEGATRGYAHAHADTGTRTLTRSTDVAYSLRRVRLIYSLRAVGDGSLARRGGWVDIYVRRAVSGI